MSRAPRVSVCMPCFNHEAFVGQAISSVLEQDYGDIELVIVDDASPDDTFSIVESFRDPRVKAVRNPHNVGFSKTYDRAIALSRGELISVLASDDFYLPGKIGRQVRVLDDSPQVAAALSWMSYHDECGAEVTRPDLDAVFLQDNRTRAEWLRSFLVNGNSLAEPTTMIRRRVKERLGRHNPLLLQAPDFEYWIRVCLEHDIHVVPERLVGYRVHASLGNISAATPEKTTRAYWEWTRLLRAFLAIEDECFMREVFPDAGPAVLDGLPVATLLIEPALSSPHLPVKLFGLDILREILTDERNAEHMENIGLGRRLLFERSGEYDTFGLKAVADLRESRDFLARAAEEWREVHDHVAAERDEAIDKLDVATVELADVRKRLATAESRHLIKRLRRLIERFGAGRVT